jgi:plasmid segregation protein ParM
MISVDIGCVSKAKEDVPVKIAVDVGYSSVKGVSEHGRVMFPSVVAPASEDLLAGVVKGNIVHRVHLRRKMDDVEEQLVGDAAVMSALAAGCLALREKPGAVHDTLLLTAAYLLWQKQAQRFSCRKQCSYVSDRRTT